MLTLDLLKAHDLQYLKELIADPACVYVHFAPPCGTASRARLIKRKNQYNPPILRTARYPNGLPTLTGIYKARVAAANRLYQITQELCELCFSHAVLFSLENPGRSFFWNTTHIARLLRTLPHFQTFLHHCRFGSSRRKYTLLVHTIPTLQDLSLLCQNDHQHEAWGKTPTGWATSEETAYPWPLCRAIAAKVALFLQNLGLNCATPACATQAQQLEDIRQQTHVQTKNHTLPLVSEFREIKQWPADSPLPALARRLNTPPVGNIASEGQVTIGFHRTPHEFVKAAAAAKHPGMMADEIPGPMLEAVKFNSLQSPEAVAKHRSETIRRLISMANTLDRSEAKLKSELSERRREVLGKKRLLLFKALLEAGSADKNLVDDICRGFDLVGRLPESNYFEKRFKPANLAPASLREVAAKARVALLGSVQSSGQPGLDSGVYEATLKEREKGFLVGPVAADTIPEGGTLTRRFGVVQRDKVRPIDDYRSSLVNAAVTQPEAVSLHGIDHVACLGSCILRSSSPFPPDEGLEAKCWDLAAAYKQVPLSDPAYHLDSYIAVYNPITGQPEIFQQKVLPFGSIASVTAFLRCATGIWLIGSAVLFLTWTSYFDDYLNFSKTSLCKHTDICISVFFRLLGWDLSEEKLVPYSQCCKILGVELVLSHAPMGSFWIQNTQARQTELTETIAAILERGNLTRVEGEKLRGRLQFASNQLFGRRFRNCLTALNTHVKQGSRHVSNDLRAALTLMSKLLGLNRPRLVDVNFLEWVHLYVDASYEQGEKGGVGGVLYDSQGNCLGFFSEPVSSELVSKIKRADQETIIFELEGLAVATGLALFKDLLRGKRLVIFTDNQAVQSCLIKSKSSNKHMDLVIRFICSTEEELDVMSWIERVPSQSNPADVFSREIVEFFEGLKKSQVNLEEMWDKSLKEAWAESLYTGEWRDSICKGET